MSNIAAHKNWENLTINDPDAVIKFFNSPEFSPLKQSVSCASYLAKYYHQDDFEDMFFKFSKEVLSSSFLALDFVTSHKADVKNKNHIAYLTSFLNDPLFCQKAVTHLPEIYQHIPQEVRQDIAVSKAAVTKDGANFFYLPEILKEDPDFKLLAAKNESSPGYQFLNEKDKSNSTYYNLAKKNFNNYEYFPDFVKIKFKKMILKQPRLLEYAPQKILQDHELIRQVLDIQGGAIKWAPDEFRHNKELCLNLYKKDPTTLVGIAPELMQDISYCKALVNSRIMSDNDIDHFINHLPEAISKSEDFIKLACQKNSYFLQHANDNIFTDIEFILNLQKKQSKTFMHIPSNIKLDNIQLMKDLCDTILQQRLIKNTDFLKIKVNDFIKNFHMDEYQEFKKYLLQQNMDKFKPLSNELDKLILGENLTASLSEKSQHIGIKI